MDHGRRLALVVSSLAMLSLALGMAHQPAWAVSYVYIDGQTLRETHVPDTVVVTADCAQLGNRMMAEIYLDLNANGVVEGTETLVQFAYINDGIPTLENEEEDEIPGDDDTQVNGLLLHNLEITEDEYSFSTTTMQFIIRLTDQDHSMAQAILRLLPPEPGRPYIGGRVTDAGTSAPLDSMFVMVWEEVSDIYRATMTDIQGRYVLDVEPGTWTIYAFDWTNNYAPSDSQQVTVGASDSAVVDLTMGPYPAYITGRVDSSGSQPVPGIMVVAAEEAGDFWVAWTQVDGSYRLGVTPGTYDVYPSFLPTGYASTPASYQGIVIEAGETITGKNFVLGHPTSRIEGRVTYEAGGGASGVTISAFSLLGYYYSTATDEDGQYSLAVLPATYFLNASMMGYDVTSPATGFYFPVVVENNQTVSGYDFVIAPSGGEPAYISGTVTYQATGQPAQGIYVVIYMDSENSPLGWGFDETDASGYYRFDGIINGTWLIGVYQPGYDSDPLLREATVYFGMPATDQDFQLVAATSAPQTGGSSQPDRFYLFPNRPNPFNDQTLIAYSLSNEEPQRVSVKIFNVLGQEVSTLVDENQRAGLHVVRWDGRNSQGLSIAAGVYLCELQAGSQRQVRKLVLLK